MMTDKPINYKLHLPLVVAFLIIQFFVVDIYSYFYLKHVYKKYSGAINSNYSLYLNGEYEPTNVRETPKDFKFVAVQQSGNQLEEIYYTLNGREITVTSLNGKWQSTSYNEGAINFYLIIPLCGFLLFGVMIVYKMIRTGAYFTWDLRKYPNDKFETVCLIYSVPLVLSSIVYGFLGNGP